MFTLNRSFGKLIVKRWALGKLTCGKLTRMESHEDLRIGGDEPGAQRGSRTCPRSHGVSGAELGLATSTPQYGARSPPFLTRAPHGPGLSQPRAPLPCPGAPGPAGPNLRRARVSFLLPCDPRPTDLPSPGGRPSSLRRGVRHPVPGVTVTGGRRLGLVPVTAPSVLAPAAGHVRSSLCWVLPRTLPMP